ncbi:MAG: hypothetical protein H6Q55_3574 [Deltaproteobacteria bacterium]|jgi:hypothetical protein|nr:hypothetical protein [Deltaproteobacteria bacterium]
MTPEEQSLSPEEMRKVMRAMQVRMRNTALRHFERIGLRTLRALQELDLIYDVAPPIGDGVDLAVLRDQQHPRRQKLPDGPLVLYITEGGEPKRMLVELPILFFSGDRNVRQAALECIEKMLVNNAMAVTPKTAALLKESRDALVSETPGEWRAAAVTVYDAIYDDVLIALNGVWQSLESESVIQGRLDFYTQKMIFPSVTSLDSISLPIGQPERDHGALTKILSDIVACASNLSELCATYLAKLGFLPLAPAYSLATAVRKWLAYNPAVDAWREVWGWANAESTPVSRYHACSVFVQLPKLIPEGKLTDFWSEVLAVVQGPNRKVTDRYENEAWALRRDLARHYAFHLEARLPNNDGSSIACFAWWFAEKVASLFAADAGAAKFYRENWVKPASNLSSHIWLDASAPIQRSFLRYVTFMVQSPWAAALLTLMGEHLDELAIAEQAEYVQARFHEALVSNALSLLPFPIETPSDPTFSLECSFADIVLKWAEYQTEEHRKDLQQLVAISRTLGTRDGVCNALRKFPESSLPDQIALCIALKAKAYTDPTIAEGVWEVVSDSKWRMNVFPAVDQQVLGPLIESLSMLLVDNREKWFSHLPHYLAELCEKEEDEERRRVLFLCVIHTSLASDTVSAVRRLLRGEKKAKFVDLVKEYRARAEATRSDYPPWVAGKLRGLMASMHVL